MIKLNKKDSQEVVLGRMVGKRLKAKQFLS